VSGQRCGSHTVELRSERILLVDDNNLPVGLLLVEKGHDTEDLDALDLTGVTDKLADLADVERVVVTLGLGLGVDGVGVLPSLSPHISTIRTSGNGCEYHT